MAHLEPRKHLWPTMFVSPPPTIAPGDAVNNPISQVARCPRTGRIECEFFLTEVDEPQARLDKTADEPPAAPQTPVSQRTTQTMAATPITDGRSRGNLFGSGGSGGGRRVANLNESPSASRFANPDGGSDDDLAKAVVELLREEGIVLKRSTESRLRHAIGDRVAQHGAALENADISLEFAYQKLRELEP